MVNFRQNVSKLLKNKSTPNASGTQSGAIQDGKAQLASSAMNTISRRCLMFAASALTVSALQESTSAASDLTFTKNQHAKRLDILHTTGLPFSLEKQKRDGIRLQKHLDETPDDVKQIFERNFGCSWHTIKRLPNCSELLEAAMAAEKPKFERKSEEFLLERYGVRPLDEALVVTGFYDYAEFMLDLSEENEV